MNPPKRSPRKWFACAEIKRIYPSGSWTSCKGRTSRIPRNRSSVSPIASTSKWVSCTMVFLWNAIYSGFFPMSVIPITGQNVNATRFVAITNVRRPTGFINANSSWNNSNRTYWPPRRLRSPPHQLDPMKQNLRTLHNIWWWYSVGLTITI